MIVLSISDVLWWVYKSWSVYNCLGGRYELRCEIFWKKDGNVTIVQIYVTL